MLKECLENEEGLAFAKVHGPCPVFIVLEPQQTISKEAHRRFFCIYLIILK